MTRAVFSIEVFLSCTRRHSLKRPCAITFYRAISEQLSEEEELGFANGGKCRGRLSQTWVLMTAMEKIGRVLHKIGANSAS